VRTYLDFTNVALHSPSNIININIMQLISPQIETICFKSINTHTLSLWKLILLFNNRLKTGNIDFKDYSYFIGQKVVYNFGYWLRIIT